MNQWPCDPINQPGSQFWYCEVGPGWKPPRELRARAIAEGRVESELQIELSHSGVQPNQEPRSTQIPPGKPVVGPNVYQTLWRAAPLKKGSRKGSVEVSHRNAAFSEAEFLSVVL